MQFKDNMYLVTEKRIRCLSVSEHVVSDYNQPVESFESAQRLLTPFFEQEPYEAVYAIAINSQNHITGFMRMEEGTINRSHVYARKILTFLLCETNATGLILAHNHPGGRLEASSEDVVLTKKIKRIIENIDVRLLDHLIYSPDKGWASMREMGFDMNQK